MDENRIAGTPRKAGGKAQEDLGRASGQMNTEAEDVVSQLKGTAQDVYGQARYNTADVTHAAREAGSSFDRLLRNTIEQQPYIGIAIAIDLGWLLGRSHRPL